MFTVLELFAERDAITHCEQQYFLTILLLNVTGAAACLFKTMKWDYVSDPETSPGRSKREGRRQRQ